MKAELTCPNCNAKTTVDIPQNGCLAFFECNGCGQIMGTPKTGDSCCVVCAYSDTTCPLPHTVKKEL